MRFEERAVFCAPPNRVWAVLVDWRSYAEWMPDVISVRTLGPPDSEREGTGLTLKVRTRVFGLSTGRRHRSDHGVGASTAPDHHPCRHREGLGRVAAGREGREHHHRVPLAGERSPVAADPGGCGAQNLLAVAAKGVPPGDRKRTLARRRCRVSPSQVNRRKRTMPWGNPPELRRTKRRHKRLQVG